MSIIAEQLAAASTTDSLKHAAQPGSLTLIPWALVVGGWSESSGWNPPGFSSSPPTGDRGGLYLNTETIKGGNAYSILRRNGSFGHIAERQDSVYLFSAMGPSASGYHCTVYQPSGTSDHYTFKLRKWTAGEAAVLAEVSEVVMEATGSFAVVADAGMVSMWVRQNEFVPWTLVGAEVADTDYVEGLSGFAGNGSNPKFINFATGTLTPPSGLSLGDSIVLTDSIAVTKPLSRGTSKRFPFSAQSGWAFKKPLHWNHLDIVRSTVRQPPENSLPWLAWFLGVVQSVTVAEQLAVSDAVRKASSSARGDEVIFGDAVSKASTHAEADAVPLSDAIGKSVGRSSSDEIAISDAVSKRPGHAEGDELPLSDAVAKGVGKAASDGLSFEDELAKGVGHAVEDELLLSDSIGKRFSTAFSDLIGFLDEVAKGIGARLADIFGLEDSATVEQELAEPVLLELSDHPAAELVLSDAAAVNLELEDTIAPQVELTDSLGTLLTIADHPSTELVLEDFPAEEG